jgi:hypothetical protein
VLLVVTPAQWTDQSVTDGQDKPERLAAILIDFWKRNTTTLVLPPKIGQNNTQAVKMVGDT